MPRPSTTSSVDTSQDVQQRITTISNSNSSTLTANMPLTINNQNATDRLTNGNSTIFSSANYHQSTNPTQPHNLSKIVSDKKSSNINFLSMHQQNNSVKDFNSSSSNNISARCNNSIQMNNNNNNNNNSNSINALLMSSRSTTNMRPVMEDKCIQCIDDNENSIEHYERLTNSDKHSSLSKINS